MKSPTSYSASELVNMQYREVGGFMLWLCASLILVGPAQCAWSFWTEFTRAPWNAYPDLLNLVRLFFYGVWALLAVFGCVAGSLLWRVHRHGRRAVKLYLAVQTSFVMLLLAIGLWGQAAAIDDTSGDIVGGMLPTVIWTIAYSTVWWLYLDRSYRVKKTYQLKYEAENHP